MHKEELASVSPATDILSKTITTEREQGDQLATPLRAAPLPVTDETSGTHKPEKNTMEEYLRLSASLPDWGKSDARDVLTEQHARQSSRDYPSPQNRREESLPPFSLIVLLALFLFLCVGVEVGFGAWVAVVVLRDDLAGEAGAIRMARCESKKERKLYLWLHHGDVNGLCVGHWGWMGGSL